MGVHGVRAIFRVRSRSDWRDGYQQSWPDIDAKQERLSARLH